MASFRHIVTLSLSISALSMASAVAHEPIAANHVPSLAPHKVAAGTAISNDDRVAPLVVDRRDLPAHVVTMSTDLGVDARQDGVVLTPETRVTKRDLIDVDLVEDNPVFVGAYDKTEFDTIDAQRSMAGMPENLDADPLIPIGAIGIETDF